MKNVVKLDVFRFCVCVVLLGGMPLAATAGDVSGYAVYKRQVYTQTNTDAPVPQSLSCVFNAIVEPLTSNTVVAATVASSTNGPAPLPLLEENEFLPRGWFFAISGLFSNQNLLDASWPNGSYSLSIAATNDGLKTLILNVQGDAYPASPPHIQNYEAAQAVDGSKDFVIRWDAFPGGTTNDLCFVAIRIGCGCVPLFNTPFLVAPKSLDGTATSVVVPAGTLAPGGSYDAYVRFDKVLARNTTDYSGAVGLATYARGTHFSLKTIAAGGIASASKSSTPATAESQAKLATSATSADATTKIATADVLNTTAVVDIFAPDPIASEGTNCLCTPVVLPFIPSNFWTFWTNFVCTNTATFVVRRSGDTNTDLVVNYSIGGTATNGVDYVTLPGSVTIPAGRHTARIVVVPLDDTDPPSRPPFETVILRLLSATTSPTNYLVGFPGKAAAVIVDKNEPCPWTGTLPDGCFHFEMPATNGFWFRIEYSTDMQNWLPICISILDHGAVHFIDSDATTSVRRFYRAVPVVVPNTWPE